MVGYFREIIKGGISLLNGMGVTIKAFFSPVFTVQYPRNTLPIPERYRGHVQLIVDPETGRSRCIACGICMRNCPSGCITVKGKKPPDAKKKVPTLFKLDFTKCSLCGICVESCTQNALEFSREYNLAGFTREEFIYDLLEKVNTQGA